MSNSVNILLAEDEPTLRHLMTGCAPDSMLRPAELREVPLLSKPFTQADLLAAVERALTPASHS
jgi:hypothetical protein